MTKRLAKDLASERREWMRTLIRRAGIVRVEDLRKDLKVSKQLASERRERMRTLIRKAGIVRVEDLRKDLMKKYNKKRGVR